MLTTTNMMRKARVIGPTEGERDGGGGGRLRALTHADDDEHDEEGVAHGRDGGGDGPDLRGAERVSESISELPEIRVDI